MLPDIVDNHPIKEFAEKLDSALAYSESFLVTRKYFILFCFSLVFLVIVFLLSGRKLLWNDEMYTLYFSQLRLWPDLWRALATGGDQLAPGSIILTKVTIRLFGTHSLFIRLPETIAFLAMSLCLYRIVSKRFPAPYGFIAMIFPCVTSAFDFSYEARPYALVLAFSASAFLFWQTYCENRQKIHLIGFGLSIFSALMSHYSAILILFPFVLGEIVRSYELRKVQPFVMIAMIMAVLPLGLFLPLLQSSMAYSSNFWGKASWSELLSFYGPLLSPATGAIVLTGIVIAVIWGRKAGQEQNVSSSLSPFEITSAVGFILLPVVGIIGAKLTTGVFVDRYALPAVIGFSILIPAVIELLKKRYAATIFLFCLCTAFVTQFISLYSKWGDDYNAMIQTNEFLEKNAAGEVPIVTTYSHIFFRLQQYGPEQLSNRTFYLADPVASVQYVHHDTIDRGLLDLKPWWPVERVKPYGLFVHSQSQFYLLHFSSDEDWRWDWILSGLLANNKNIELKARDGNQMLFLVTNPLP